MANSIPAIQRPNERLLRKFVQCFTPEEMAGDFLVYVDDAFAGTGPTLANAAMQAETLYRYFSGTVSVVDRATRATRVTLFSRS